MRGDRAGEASELRRRAACLADQLAVVVLAEHAWTRLSDAKNALVDLSDEQRTLLLQATGRLGSGRIGTSRDEHATGEAVETDLTEHEGDFGVVPPTPTDLCRDTRLVVAHPTVVYERDLRERLAGKERDLRRCSGKGRSSSRLLKDGGRILAALAVARAESEAAREDKGEYGPLTLADALELGGLVSCTAIVRSRAWKLALAQAWSFAAVLLFVAAGDLFVLWPNVTNTIVLLAVAFLGPAIVVFEAYRPQNRRAWIPRWAVVRSCVLALILGAYVLWLSGRSADGGAWVLATIAFLALAGITVAVVDGRGMLSQASLSSVLASVLAASSLITFLYTEQYKPRVSVPLLTTTVNLAPEQGLTRTDPHRLVMLGTVTVKNDGDSPVQIMGSLYRVEGTPTVDAPAPAVESSDEVLTGFNLLQGSPARFSVAVGAKVADEEGPTRLLQTDELIPMDYHLAKGETWATSISVVVDPTAVGLVRMSTEVIAARSTHLTLEDPVPCEPSDEPHYAYRCWYRTIGGRSFVDELVLRADRIYVYLVTGDRLVQGGQGVPTLLVSGQNLKNETQLPVDQELAKLYSLGEFSTSVEWAN